jgi:hypothetical protein
LQGQANRRAPRLHPLRDVAFRLPQALQGTKDLCKTNLGQTAAIEVAVQRRGEFTLAGKKGPNQTVQTRPALGSRGIRIFSESRPLAGKDRF